MGCSLKKPAVDFRCLGVGQGSTAGHLEKPQSSKDGPGVHGSGSEFRVPMPSVRFRQLDFALSSKEQSKNIALQCQDHFDKIFGEPGNGCKNKGEKRGQNRNS